MLPKILEAMPPEAKGEKPRRSGHRRRGNHDEDRRHAAFDDDPGLSPVGHGEPDVDRRDQHQPESVNRRRIEPPEGKWRRRLESAEDGSPEDGSTWRLRHSFGEGARSLPNPQPVPSQRFTLTGLSYVILWRA